MTPEQHLTLLLERLPSLTAQQKNIRGTYELLANMYADGGKLLLCGNGGSAADCGHIAGELMKGFLLKRTLPTNMHNKLGDLSDCLQGALPAIDLTQHHALSTAFANDVNPDFVFAQQVYGYGRQGDTLLAISTSGNSRNCINATQVAKAIGLNVIVLTGSNESSTLATLADVAILVPANETYAVQEYHLPIYHTLCAMLEAHFFQN